MNYRLQRKGEYRQKQFDDVDMSDIEAYNDIIEKFIVESNPDAMRKTKNNIKAIGQQEYGVVLNDGCEDYDEFCEEFFNDEENPRFTEEEFEKLRKRKVMKNCLS